MRVKGELVDAESAVDVKPVIENKHVLNFGGKLNPAVDTGSTGAKAEPLETEDVKPRGSELPRNRCREEQVLFYSMIIPRLLRILNLYTYMVIMVILSLLLQC